MPYPRQKGPRERGAVPNLPTDWEQFSPSTSTCGTLTAENTIYTTPLVARELSRFLLGQRPSTVFEYCGFCSCCCSNADNAGAAAASSCKVLGRSTRALFSLLANAAQAYTLSAVFFVNVVRNSLPTSIFLSGRRNSSQSDQTGNSFLLPLRHVKF